MSKGKKIYFLVLLLITILVTTFYFSYAIFSNTQEEHGKLNIVAGTLNYKIESSELDSDSITLSANTSKEIKVKVTSLNDISSKYELYYVLDKVNDKVNVGYSSDSKDEAKGIIDANNSKMISVIIRNESDISSTITFKVIGGLVNNDLALKDGSSLVNLCSYDVGYVWNFDYTGGEQEFTVPCSGQYKLETWGAQGGGNGGVGGYSFGMISLKLLNKLYIDVGGTGFYNKTITNPGGYNGGGYSGKHLDAYSYGGGGATHISTTAGLLLYLENDKDKILIVAGGGGGSVNVLSVNGGNGGGYIGNYGSTYEDSIFATPQYVPTGGSQLKPGYGYINKSGIFGSGSISFTDSWGGGGGGGYYGGGSGCGTTGAGGSGYIGNQLLTNKAMYCYNCEESSEESTKTISTTCVSETPTSNCSKQGNGYARITYLGN